MTDTHAPAAPAIRCRGLHKRFGQTVAVRSLDLEVRRGECFGLLGPNGAGKTTTIEILEGLQPLNGGEVEILGMRWDRDAAAIRQRLGVQLQESEFPDRLTAGEIVRMFRAFYDQGPSVEELIDFVQLAEKADTQVRHLSGGQRQRLSVACALAGEPDILFLDEPTTGLDPQSRRQLWDVVDAFRARGGTILLTTHFMDEAEKLSDRIAILDQGQIIAQGTPQELIQSLGGAHVIDFAATVEPPEDRLRALPGATNVRRSGERILISVDEPARSLPALLEMIGAAGGELTALTTHRATLDDVFLAMTGRALRDE
ncbi:ABC transporter ATP-binding protein [Longimicrobium sp.]|uniref:ABC transporter ATP-binding protein n=1 Tax=Longimicrobium sp. TaxID=2029185 RepID=UPI002E3311BA|nr:ABC transporter ATP-binding protein [Longimicrobium sp.]HEX6040576.1 ABC transporter ATP-binding protein [Longimicrobium sp.]